MQTELYPPSTLKPKSNKMAYVGSINDPEQGIDRNEWYTPERYLRAATHVLGRIDFDPYSDEVANRTVKAKEFFTKQNPIHSPWPTVKTVFMNPPYGRGLIDLCVDRFLIEYCRQRFEAIVLTNNATETQWFQQLLSCSLAACLTNHRIAFVSTDGKKVSGNTRGQTFFYFGKEFELFRIHFKEFGAILSHDCPF